MTIKAIIFDFDGVLAESVNVKGDAFVALYKDEPQSVQKQVLDYHQKHGGVTRYDKIRYYEKTLCNRAVNEQRVEEIAQKFSDIVEDGVIRSLWVDGAQEFLEKHYKVMPFYIASATPEEELIRIVKARNMAHYFKGVYGAPVKKHEHISNVMENNNLLPYEIVMIGDAMTDYDAAKVTGTHFIGRRLPNAFSPFPKGTKLIHDLKELEQCLRLF